MSCKPWPTRFALWLAMCALLLKAAVPMLATASAQMQGKTLVEVCTVYGVATVALDDAGSAPQPEHLSSHAGDHCALSGLLAWAAPQPASAGVPASPSTSSWVSKAPPVTQAPDACAAWVARLKHGPPTFA